MRADRTPARPASTIARGAWIAAALIACGAAASAEPSPAASAARAPFASTPLAAARLAAQRGGSGGSEAQLVGSVSETRATNVTTGANTLAGGAFAGASGVATVIQNTGNNVLIQNSTIVNVQLK